MADHISVGDTVKLSDGTIATVKKWLYLGLVEVTWTRDFDGAKMSAQVSANDLTKVKHNG